MSYRSRLYNHRNVQPTETENDKPFFSKQIPGSKAQKKGNFFQARLSVNVPGDKYEQEADSAAIAVVNNENAKPVLQPKKISSIQRLTTPSEDEEPGTNDAHINKDTELQAKAIQRVSANPEKEKIEGVQKMGHAEDEKEEIQKMDSPVKEEDEKKNTSGVQTKQDAGVNTVPDHFSSRVESRAGKGNILPRNTLNEMSSSFGADFTDVRVHHDSEAATMNKEIHAQAFTHGSDIYFNEGKFNPESSDGKFLLAHELTHVIQQGGKLKRKTIQRNGDPVKKPLLDQFGEKFPDSIDIIKKSPEALLLVKEASDAGVEFGGYSEEGPVKNTWPYTIGNKVYVPKARKPDKMNAAKGFLFEINNAIRHSAFKVLTEDAVKGSKGTLTAKTYATKVVEKEVEGMLRLGQVWVDMKKNKPKGEHWDKYDATFYLSEYQEFKAGKKSKSDIVKDVLARVYPEGINKGKTVEQYYMDQYNGISGGK